VSDGTSPRATTGRDTIRADAMTATTRCPSGKRGWATQGAGHAGAAPDHAEVRRAVHAEQCLLLSTLFAVASVQCGSRVRNRTTAVTTTPPALTAALRHDQLRRAAADALHAWSVIYPRAAYQLGADPDFHQLASAMTALRRNTTPLICRGWPSTNWPIRGRPRPHIPTRKVKEMTDIDERAAAMTDDERDDYLTAHGWQNIGVGWVPSGGTEEQFPGGAVIRTLPRGGLYSRSSAIREALAREDPDATPDAVGRYYHGDEPEDSIGQRW
jgi:hypothetical protein